MVTPTPTNTTEQGASPLPVVQAASNSEVTLAPVAPSISDSPKGIHHLAQGCAGPQSPGATLGQPDHNLIIGALPPSERADYIRQEFARLESALNILREEIKDTVENLAEHSTDPDAFVNGLCQLSKQTSCLNSYLLKVQVAIRFGTPL